MSFFPYISLFIRTTTRSPGAGFIGDAMHRIVRPFFGSRPCRLFVMRFRLNPSRAVVNSRQGESSVVTRPYPSSVL